MPGPHILIVDSSGQPVRWAHMNRAARYYAAGKVLTELGASSFELLGGTQETTGQRSMLATNSIVMIRGHLRAQRGHVAPTKHRLFLRDRHLCAYCGQRFSDSELTIEHITPLSQGGHHRWTNVVTACRACNGRKGGRTPEQAHMPLLFVPYAVSRCEGFILSNRRILADQMAFLRATLPKHSRWSQ